MASVSKTSCAAGQSQAANKGTPRKTSATQAFIFKIFILKMIETKERRFILFFGRCVYVC